MIIVFDTETTGLGQGISTNDNSHPKVVQIAWLCLSDTCEIISKQQLLVDPGVLIPPEVTRIHGIDDAVAASCGTHSKLAIKSFLYAASKASIIVGHNIRYDLKMVEHEAFRAGILETDTYKAFDTAYKLDTNNRHLLGLERPDGKKHPSIKLADAWTQISKVPFDAHNALDDSIICAKLLAHAYKRGKIDIAKILREVAERDDA